MEDGQKNSHRFKSMYQNNYDDTTFKLTQIESKDKFQQEKTTMGTILEDVLSFENINKRDWEEVNSVKQMVTKTNSDIKNNLQKIEKFQDQLKILNSNAIFDDSNLKRRKIKK